MKENASAITVGGVTLPPGRADVRQGSSERAATPVSLKLPSGEA